MRKSDVIFDLELIAMQGELARELMSSDDYRLIKPYIHKDLPNDVVKAEIDGVMSRSTFYRTLKRLTAKSESIVNVILDYFWVRV